MSDWNPALYLKFEKERTRPALDLISRISLEQPEDVIDIGCGPGNSTQVLKNRWPKAAVTGLDSSLAMIAKARQDFPGQNWIVGKAEDLTDDQKYDVVFSNATIQWIPDHKVLLNRLMNLLKPGGVLAVQIPLFTLMPVCGDIVKAGSLTRFSNYCTGSLNSLTFESPGFYYDVLAGLSQDLNIWTTDYCHILSGHQALVDFVKPTGMKPALDRLPDDELRQSFEQAVLQEVRKSYPAQSDGKVLFPFKRLMFNATRKE